MTQLINFMTRVSVGGSLSIQYSSTTRIIEERSNNAKRFGVYISGYKSACPNIMKYPGSM